jgi:hypothetical protein
VTDTLKLDVQDGVGWIVLNRPEARNAVANGSTSANVRRERCVAKPDGKGLLEAPDNSRSAATPPSCS